MKNKLSIFITVFSLLIGFATNMQAQASTNAEDPEYQKAFEKLVGYSHAFNDPSLEHAFTGNNTFAILKLKINTDLNSLDQEIKLANQDQAIRSRAIRAVGSKINSIINSKDGSKNVLDDFDNALKKVQKTKISNAKK